MFGTQPWTHVNVTSGSAKMKVGGDQVNRFLRGFLRGFFLQKRRIFKVELNREIKWKMEKFSVQ